MIYNTEVLKLGPTVPQPAPNNDNRILKNATIKYLSNFWRSREMPLINCKVELKLKWTKHCVLFVPGNEIMMLTLIVLFLLSKITIIISFQKELLTIITSSSMEKTFMTNQLILI